MWQLWRRRRRVDGAGSDREVIGAATDILHGTVLDRYVLSGQEVPPWAVLNALAHRPLGRVGEVVKLLTGGNGTDWAPTAAVVARALRSARPEKAAEIRQMLLSTELEALASGPAPGHRALMREVRRQVDRLDSPPTRRDGARDGRS